MNVNPTVEVIMKMAKELEYRAEALRRTANKMKESEDLTYAGEVMNEVVAMIANLRLDLLVVRPLRETMK